MFSPVLPVFREKTLISKYSSIKSTTLVLYLAKNGIKKTTLIGRRLLGDFLSWFNIVRFEVAEEK